jgi:hypothetical protein
MGAAARPASRNPEERILLVFIKTIVDESKYEK